MFPEASILPETKARMLRVYYPIASSRTHKSPEYAPRPKLLHHPKYSESHWARCTCTWTRRRSGHLRWLPRISQHPRNHLRPPNFPHARKIEFELYNSNLEHASATTPSNLSSRHARSSSHRFVYNSGVDSFFTSASTPLKLAALGHVTVTKSKFHRTQKEQEPKPYISFILKILALEKSFSIFPSSIDDQTNFRQNLNILKLFDHWEFV
jgi:hypothetical protein